MTSRTYLYAGAFLASLALGAGSQSAAAQSTSSNQQTGSDTSGYSSMSSDSAGGSASSDRSSSSASGASSDTALRAAPGTQTGPRSGKQTTARGKTPKTANQGGAADTSGLAEFTETMGDSVDMDTLTAAGKTTNYREKKQYKNKPSVVDTTPVGSSGSSSNPSK